MENDQAKIAMREEAAEPGTAAVTMPPVPELWILVAVFPAGKTQMAVTMRMSVVHSYSE